LLLDLRGEVSPHVSSESEKTGYYFTYIDLPAGSYLPKSAGSTQQTQQTGQATAAAEPAPAAPTQAAAQAATKVAAPTATTRTPMFHRTKYREPQGEMPGTLTLPD